MMSDYETRRKIREWISENIDSLPQKEHVAVGENGVVAHNQNFDALQKELARKRISLPEVVIIYVPDKNEVIQ